MRDMLLFPGAVIRRERLRRNWSQEGLCQGICAVSYLSKIEQCKAEASREILRMLFARLELPWYDDEKTLAAAKLLAERCYEMIFAGDGKTEETLWTEFLAAEPRMAHSPFALDAAVLRGFFSDTPADEALERYFDSRQLALQRLLQGREEEAMLLFPCAYFSLMTGTRLYERGENTALAVEHLRRTYELASQEGHVRIMLDAQSFIGNCYCNQLDIESMERHYRVAARIAAALGDETRLQTLRYNAASSCLEAGRSEEAYAYFASLDRPDAMDLHKLAVCCEKLGLRAEALSALDRAEAMDCPSAPLARELCGPVRFRLEHEDYLCRPEYGEALLSVFDRCRRELPVGYALFHLPWVLEWHTARRQYRTAYELAQSFPVRPLKKQV